MLLLLNMKKILIISLVIVFIATLLFLLYPMCATYEYKENYQDMCWSVPRWKIYLFSLTGFNIYKNTSGQCKPRNESNCEQNLLCKKIYNKGTRCDPVGACQPTLNDKYIGCFSRL